MGHVRSAGVGSNNLVEDVLELDFSEVGRIHHAEWFGRNLHTVGEL